MPSFTNLEAFTEATSVPALLVIMILLLSSIEIDRPTISSSVYFLASESACASATLALDSSAAIAAALKKNEDYDKSDAKQLYKIAFELLYVSGGLSTSILQRRLKIGYGRAARVIDFLIDAEIAFRDISDIPIRYKPLLEYDKAIERFRLFYADKAE